MKNKKLEEKVELAKLIVRATWAVPLIIAVSAGAIISKESKRIYYNLFKIPYVTFVRDDIPNYIRLDK